MSSSLVATSTSLLPPQRAAQLADLADLAQRADLARSSSSSSPPRADNECVSEPSKSRSVWSLLWEMVAPDAGLFAAAVLATIASSAVSLFIPPAVSSLISSLRRGSSIVGGVARLASVVALQASLSASYIGLLARVSQRMVARLRVALFDALLARDMVHFDAARGGEVSALLSADVEAVRACIKHSVSIGVKSLVVLTGGCVSMALISAQMTALLFAALPLSVWGGSIFARHLRGLSAHAAGQTAGSLALAEEYLANIKTVRAFAAEPAAVALFALDTERATSTAASLGARIGVFHGVTVLGLYSLVIGVVGYGSSLVQAGTLASDAIVTFMLHASRMQSAFASLSILSGQLVKGGDAAGRIADVLADEPTIPLRSGADKVGALTSGHVAFNGIAFTYPTRPAHPVLHHVSFEVPRGSVVALVGPSGSGKSTLASLLLRFYDPDEGSITIDGVPLTAMDPRQLRANIAIVSQEPDLFAGSIASNIAFGAPHATRAEIEAAARIASAHDFISAFPDGYDTLVGDRGVQLSGGQKQRIAIARAVLKDPRILILDESTASLDAQSEAAVQAALDNIMRDRATIVIAHRLSTIRECDNIIVLEYGNVVAQGTHTQLLADPDSLYAQLVAAQMH